MRRCALLIILVVLAPTAQAESVSGTFVATGGLTLPASSVIESLPSALFANMTAGQASSFGDSPQVTIHLFEKRFASTSVTTVTPLILVAESHPSWDLHDVHAQIDAEAGSWVALHAKAGTLSEAQNIPVALQLEAAMTIGNGHSAPDEGRPDVPYYMVSATNTIPRVSEFWTYNGSGEIKLKGPKVVIVSRENTTTIQTGEFSDPQNPAETIQRWLVIDFDIGTVTASRMPTQIASSALTARSDGTIQLRDARGSLAGRISEWQAINDPLATLSGELTSRVEANAAADGLQVAISGDLKQTSMSARVAVPAAGSVFPLVGLIVGVAVCGAGAAYVVKRKRNRPELGPDEYAQLADAAGDAEDFARAANYARKARALSPTSKRLALDHAFFLTEAGDERESLRILADPLLAEDPDAHLLRARVHLKAGRLDEAARALADALDAHPASVFDIETDDRFAPIMERSTVQAALRRARNALR